jgi:hypothetical protein
MVKANRMSNETEIVSNMLKNGSSLTKGNKEQIQIYENNKN